MESTNHPQHRWEASPGTGGQPGPGAGPGRWQRAGRGLGSPVARGLAVLAARLGVLAVVVGGALIQVMVWIAPYPAVEPDRMVVPAGGLSRMVLGYRGTVHPGPQYPDGLVATGDPVPLHGLGRLTLEITHAAGTGRPASAPRAVTAQLEGAGGWFRPLPVTITDRVESAAGGVTRARLELADIRRLLAQPTTETGRPPTGVELVVSPQVADWAPRMRFTLTGDRLWPDTSSLLASDNVLAAASVAGALAVAANPPGPLAALGALLPTVGLRAVASLGLLALMWCAVLAIDRRVAASGTRMRSRRVVQVVDPPLVGDRRVATVASPAALAQVADAGNLPIFEVIGAAGPLYLVDDGPVRYCWPGAPAGGEAGASGAAPAAPGPAAAGPETPITGQVAYGFRQPLTAMQAYLELLADLPGQPLTAVQRGLVDRITQGASRLTRMVDSVTILAELTTDATGAGAGAQPGAELAAADLVDVGPLLNEVCRPEADLGDTELIALDGAAGHALPQVRGDSRRLSLALDELLHHTARAGGENGHLTVSAEQSERHLVLSITQDDVAEAELATAAAPGSPAGGNQWPELDLGLTVARKIIDFYGGEVDLDPRGTSAVVRLPAAV